MVSKSYVYVQSKNGYIKDGLSHDQSVMTNSE